MIPRLFKRLYTKGVQGDKDKIQDIQARLGDGWVAVDNYHFFPTLEIKQDGTLVVKDTQGAPVKLFVNLNTLEVKPFLIAAVEEKEDAK